MPCLPPLAILGGHVLSSIAEGNEPAAKRLVFINGFFLSLMAVAGIAYPLMDKNGGVTLFFYTLPASASLTLFAFCGVFFYYRREQGRMVQALCLLALINLLVFSRGFAMKAEQDSYKAPATTIRERAEPGNIVVSYRSIAQGLGFYLKQRIVLVNAVGELKFGAIQEKDRHWFIDSRELKNLWFGETRVFLVTEKQYEKEIEQLLGKHNIVEIARIRDIVIFSTFQSSHRKDQ